MLTIWLVEDKAGLRRATERALQKRKDVRQVRAQEIRARIEHDHARRIVQRAMRDWTGPDGPEDGPSGG